MNQDEIMHSGVKGMRWGVRKARPSSGGGGANPAKKKITPAQKKAARAKVKAKAAKLKETRLVDIQKRRDAAMQRAAAKAEKSIMGVGMAKVPGKLEFYRSRMTGTISDGAGNKVRMHNVTKITPNKVLARAALGLAVAGLVAANR